MNSPKGFSLVELMVTVTIIALVTAVMAVNYSDARKNTRDSQRQMVMIDMAASLDLYRASNFGLVPTVSTAWQNSFSSLISGGFIKTSTVETEPLTSRDNKYTYTYCADADGHKMLLIAFLEKVSGSQSVAGNITSYTSGQCTNQGGVITSGFSAWQSEVVCGTTLSNGMYAYCLGAL